MLKLMVGIRSSFQKIYEVKQEFTANLKVNLVQ